jgi:hypothetical protein
MHGKKGKSEEKVNFHEITTPEECSSIAGYAFLIDKFDIIAPLPHQLSAVGKKHKRYIKDGWEVFTPRHKPDNTITAHLTFALRYEGVDLAILSNLFQGIDKSIIENWVQSEPTGQYSRRIWFFYEWLTGQHLDLQDSDVSNFIDAVDTKLQFGITGERSKRHKVRNNLAGTQNFCPLIRKTQKLKNFVKENWSQKALDAIGVVHPDVLHRASAFLLLKDSKASFAIEGETPPHKRAEHWGKAIGQAGQKKLTLKELEALQRTVIGDKRFIKLGYRTEGGFIGQHDRDMLTPIPDHISAKWEDIEELIQAIIDLNNTSIGKGGDAVLTATLVAFGFVFVHPFEDGNGRIHRYLIHHVLTSSKFVPDNTVFPISAAILDRLSEYRRVLESYSLSKLPFINWRPTKNGNVEVLNETKDLYRFFDATLQAEFLYECIQETIEKILPEEVLYLDRYDKMKSVINEQFDMPDRLKNILIKFLEQNEGNLSNRARDKEFKMLSNEECEFLNEKYHEIFN